MEKKSFKWKSFISFGLFISFFIIALTGVVLYITPAGRVAKWVDWRLLGLDKEQWQGLHTIFSFTFLVLSIFHIFTMNWKVFMSYLKKKGVEGFHMKREFAAGVILAVVLFAGTLVGLPPFQTVMDVGEYFTESWENTDQKAPVAHTEALTIEELSKQVVQLTPGEIMSKLAEHGIQVKDKTRTLADIGKAAGKSPYELYQLISKDAQPRRMGLTTLKAGGGIGRKTLTEIAQQVGVPVDRLIEKLKKSGIETSADRKLKDIAADTGITPYEIIEHLK